MPDLTAEEVRRQIETVPHWYHQIEVAPGVVAPGVNDAARTLEHLPLPDDCTGMRVLDIGARDGFFSFALERRGAEVVAMDYESAERTGFPVAKRLLGSAVEYTVGNVYDLSPERYGIFDLVLFLGVLYHLRHPLLALDRIARVCRERLVVETELLDEGLLNPHGDRHRLQDLGTLLVETPLAQLHPRDELNSDFSNWWVPNAAGLKAMLESSGFEVGEVVKLGGRGIAAGRRVEDPVAEYHRRLDRSLVADVLE